jgi:hypothetical protein
MTPPSIAKISTRKNVQNVLTLVWEVGDYIVVCFLGSFAIVNIWSILILLLTFANIF